MKLSTPFWEMIDREEKPDWHKIGNETPRLNLMVTPATLCYNKNIIICIMQMNVLKVALWVVLTFSDAENVYLL